jgi:hypothetical protein
VRLRGEVDDGVELLLREQPLGEVEVADVAVDEADVEPVEVPLVAGVREEVEDDDAVVRLPLEPVTDEGGADEAGGAGDEQPASFAIRSAPRYGGARGRDRPSSG